MSFYVSTALRPTACWEYFILSLELREQSIFNPPKCAFKRFYFESILYFSFLFIPNILIRSSAIDVCLLNAASPGGSAGCDQLRLTVTEPRTRARRHPGDICDICERGRSNKWRGPMWGETDSTFPAWVTSDPLVTCNTWPGLCFLFAVHKLSRSPHTEPDIYGVFCKSGQARAG